MGAQRPNSSRHCEEPENPCIRFFQQSIPIPSYLLALACGDAVWMLANSTYSILSPEGFASILWKDSRRAGEAAEIMQLTPTSLLKKQVIEGIIAEPADHQQVTENISAVLTRELTRLEQYSPEELMNKRHQRYRKF